MKKLLITTDFEENYARLIDKGVELASKFKSKIWLLHITAPDPDFVGYDVGPQYIRDERASEIKREHKMLLENTRKIKALGIEAEGILIQGPTVEMILNEAMKLGVDLIIVGFRKRGFLHKALIGETSAEVIKDSDIPILVVPLK